MTAPRRLFNHKPGIPAKDTSAFWRMARLSGRAYPGGSSVAAMNCYPHRFVCCAVIVMALCGTVTRADAKPDFSASEIITTSSTVVEGGVARFQVRLRNDGDEPAEAAEVMIQWPAMGYLVETTGLDDAQVDHDAGTVKAIISLPVKGERLVDVAVLAPRDSAGNLLSLTVRLIHFHTMAEHWFHGKIEIDTRARTDGLLIGGLRITTAGMVTLGWLGVTCVVLLLVSLLPRGEGAAARFFGPRAGAAAIMVALGFWLIFAAMAWHDYQVLFHWKETTGTIIGRRVAIQTVSSSQRLGSGATSQTRHSDVAKPEFAVRYQVDGRERLSTGYDTDSSLRVGGGKAQLEKEFQEWTIGARVPCWYDPADPAAIVLKRGFGGAYLFALLPLFPFWIGWRILRGSFSRTL